MCATKTDPVRERLNYFNGQRLTATDLRTEQGHHVGMRRVLNRSLYTQGIVIGLDVERAPEDPIDPTWKHKVRVRRGLAFDHLGREIFVPEDVLVLVMGAPSTTPGVVFGNLLSMSYREHRRQPVRERCAVVTPDRPCSGDVPWGAPSRIVADWEFDFIDSWPPDDSGRIVLAQVELNANCEVVRVIPGVRRYAIPTKPQTVRAVALEGEKDINADNPKLLYFHLDGGFPNAATLHLRSRLFSTLHYTELARHTHDLNGDLSTQPGVAGHSHSLGEIVTGEGLDPEDVELFSLAHFGSDADYAIRMWEPATDADTDAAHVLHNLTTLAELQVANTLHTHSIAAGQMTNTNGAVPSHSHTFDTLSADAIGHQPGVRAGAAYTYFGDLQVKLNGINITAHILDQLKANGPDWPTLKLGVAGNAAHLLVATGTGPIDLLRIPGVDLAPNQEHVLEFTPTSGGGQLHYNLYVE
ncbi:MAG TPA: hypothetical protein VLJ62_13145 [Burkholderiaceae bacterium]|nr:hypothetical protein [Burkholderiaceae bacterium]